MKSSKEKSIWFEGKQSREGVIRWPMLQNAQSLLRFVTEPIIGIIFSFFFVPSFLVLLLFSLLYCSNGLLLLFVPKIDPQHSVKKFLHIFSQLDFGLFFLAIVLGVYYDSSMLQGMLSAKLSTLVSKALQQILWKPLWSKLTPFWAKVN